MNRDQLKYLVLPLIVALSACASGSVTRDWDREFDFSELSSFAWREDPERQRRNSRNGVSELVDARIERSLTSAFEAKGFDETPLGRADFVFTYFTAFNRQVVTFHSGFGGGRWGGGFRSGTSTRRSYPVGTLVVDVYDTNERRLVWRGVGERVFNSTTPSDEKVAHVVARILRDFPPTD